jgi:hypothetical protein
MTQLATTHPTLLDVARRLDPDGKVSAVVEVLNQYNDILDDISYIEGNLPTGHKISVRSSLPNITWRLLNRGTVQTKSSSSQVTETVGIMSAFSEIDVDLADLNGNTNEFRFSEDLAFIESMGQQFSTTFVYGDTSVNPERFVGLAPRYYSLDTAVTTSGNVIDAGGTGSDNTSIWLVGWSPRTITGIYPKGSKVGLQIDDMGKQRVLDDDNNPFTAYVTEFKWKVGIAVKDWRFVVRIANIDVSDLLTSGDDTDVSANIMKYMSQALDLLPPIGGIRPVFYSNNTVRSMLRVKIFEKANMHITFNEIQSPISGLNRPTLQFMGTPCRRIDAITNTEARITT